MIKDPFGREASADQIAKLIKEKHGRKTGFVFGISGDWGEGKTEFLKTLKPKVESYGFTVVEFNPWRYAQEPETLRRTFLKTLYKELCGASCFIQKWWYGRNLNRLEEEISTTCFNWENLRNFGILLLVLPAIALWGINSFPRAKEIVVLISTVIAIPLILQLLQVKRTVPKVSSIDQFEDFFEQVLGQNTKIVVFIDDLDRCTPEGAKNVLDSIGTFFQTEKCSYVVTGDHAVLERYVGKLLWVKPKFKEGKIDEEETATKEELEGKRFLKKIFNVYWQLPRIDQVRFSIFIEKKVNESKLYFGNKKRNIIEMLLRFLPRNPRAVERMIELMKFALESIQIQKDGLDKILRKRKKIGEFEKNLIRNFDDVINNKDMLTKVLLIQDLFPNVFQKCSENREEIIKLEKSADVSSLKLSEDSQKLTDILKYPPFFVNQEEGRFNFDPDTFFSLAGFAGSPRKGVETEVFIQKLRSTAQDLPSELNVEPTRRAELLEVALEDLKQSLEQPHRPNVVESFLLLFEAEDVDSEMQEVFDQFIDSGSAARTWGEKPDDWKIEFYKKIARLLNKEAHFEKFLKNDPWAQRKDLFWTGIKIGNIPIEGFKSLIVFIDKNQTEGVDIGLQDAAKTSIIESLFGCVSISSLVDSADLIEGFIKLSWGALLKKEHFGYLVSWISKTFKSKKATGKIKNKLINYLNKNSSLWNNTALSYSIIRGYFKKNGKLAKTLRRRYSKQLGKIKKSWSE